MSYTLNISGKEWPTVRNPTETDIRATVASLTDDFEPIFFILRRDARSMIQVTYMAPDRFVIQYQEGGEDDLYQATKQFSAEAAVELSLAYLAGTPDWKKLAEWSEMKSSGFMEWLRKLLGL